MTSEVETAFPERTADADTNQAGQTSTHRQGAQRHDRADEDQREIRLETPSLEHRQQLEFQDSNLSPGLPLLPTNHEGEPRFTEYSLFQQSGNEFVPLRPDPDISVASEKFSFAPQNCTTQASEHGLLSEYPLMQTTLPSEGETSLCSLSQHSFSPPNEDRSKTTSYSSLSITADRKESPPTDNTEPVTDPQDHPEVEAAEDEAFFLNKEVTAQHLLELLQKDIGMQTDSSSSTVSSEYVVSGKINLPLSAEPKSSQTCKQAVTQAETPQEPPCEVSLSQKQLSDSDSCCEQSWTLPSEDSNVTAGPRSTRPDHSSEVLHRQLLKETEQPNSCRGESEKRQSLLPAGQSVAPHPTEVSQGKPSDTDRVLCKGSWTGPFSVGVERSHKQQHLLSLGNQTDIDWSYLGFLPQSQSTPGVFKAPSKSSIKAKAEQLSAIESSKENCYQSDAGISPQSCDYKSKESNHSQGKAASAEVPSLPSVSYTQKVDAWRANQTSGKTSLLDSLTLQGFSGLSPKKKAYDAISDTPNHLPSEKVRSLQQPPMSVPANQSVAESSSVVPPGSALKRGTEGVVSSIPGENDNTGCSKGPSALLSTASRSSSLSTVIPGRKDQGTRSCAENEENLTADNVQHDPSATAQPSALLGLGRFSDASADPDLTPSTSQDSNGSGMKLATSVGTSSVVSLEVDNYAPYWTSKASTPSPQQRSRELNIEERIPLYLQNLGIDQSPSTILTPFVPRGPIREPEFSPTDLCTIKGSTGTPTKSTQTSEGDSPSKGEFSGCSVMSVDSSISIAFSLDSLGPGASIPEQLMQPSTLDPEEMQNQLPSSPQPDEDSYPSTLQTTLQQQRDSSLTSSQNTIQVGDRFDSDVSLSTEGRESSESSFRGSTNEFTETSFVSSKPMLEMGNLTEAENVLSAGSYVVSSVTSHILSEENMLLSPRDKNMELQEPSFSSAAVDPRSQSSRLWAGSSSDSMLTSELGENTADQESMMSSQMPNCPSATTSCRQQENGTVNTGAGSSFVLSQSVRRTEPEGCSAAPPDNAVPSQPAATTPSASGLRQLPPPAVMAADTAEEKQAAAECPQQDITSPLLIEDNDQGVMSDWSSGSSLAVKVTELLQTESPATVVSSTSSMTDQEEGKAREWIKLKVSGQRCEPLELHEEDRRRIEEIKKELLLRNPLKSPESTDTESTSSSSFRLQREPDPAPEAETFTTSRDAVTKQTQTLQSHSTDLTLSTSQLQNLSRPDLEAQIREIAAREGVTLTRTNPRAFTSITIASRRRATSPSPSASPAPELLHLSELSTDTVDGDPPPTEEQRTTTEAAFVFELSSLLYQGNRSLNSQRNPGIQSRRDATGGRLEEALLPPEDSGTQQDTLTLSVLPGCGSAREGEEAAAPSTPESPARSGHVSHVHLTLSPKSTSHSLAPVVTSPPMDSGSALTPKELLPVRHRSSASSPDEGVGLASPPEWYRNTEPMRQQAPEREDTCTLYRTSDRLMAQSFPASQRAVESPRPQTTEAPAPPVLWPYKPKGSEELFYIPQREADVTSSETTMESSHPGSDDAVPPRFGSDVLGHGDPGISRGVSIRHTEGIYSRRLETSSYQMQEPEQRAESTTQTNGSRPLQPSSPAPITGATALRDWGTSPGHFPSYNQSALSRDRFQPSYEEVEYEDSSHHLVTDAVPPLRDQDLPLPQSSALQSSSTLDQLWERFCAHRSLEDSQPTSDGEASLLERLERLSRLIQSTRGSKAPGTNQGSEEEAQRRDGGKRNEVGETRWRVREGRRTRAESYPSRQAWRMEEPSEPTNVSLPSTCSHGGPHHQHLRPADRDETDTVSTSGSVSTVDTARLVRAFGSHRVQLLKTSSSLRRLYSTIDKQRAGGGERGGRTEEQPSSITASHISEDSAVTAESRSSTSTYTLPSHHGPSRTLTAKKAVKVANKGIQAGDLELVCNGTRRHTRDVGTTFPSPAESRPSREISSSSSSLEGGGGWSSPSKTQRRRKSKKSPSKVSQGVSWFIPAEELRAEGRKENFNEEEERWRPSTSWFEPYSRIKAWREPLRQRPVPEDKNTPSLTRHHQPDRRTKPASSAPSGLSLQEALVMRRPDFISQSRQRLRRLALQVEARKLQEVFSRRREERFSRPGGAARQLRPAGNTRRAVPRKEMIQRSKQIYNNLPEVRKRREEERRRAQYDSYRLKAQLYNKRITSHVLGRRTAWQ